MKSFITLCLLLVAGLALADFEDNFNVDADTKAQIKVVEAKCIDETKADAALVKKFDEGVFSDDPKVKCHHKCVFVNLGLMSEGGAFDKATLHSIVPEKDWVPADKCVELKGADSCDTAYKAYKCYIEHLLKK